MQLPVKPNVEEILDFYRDNIDDSKSSPDSKRFSKTRSRPCPPNCSHFSAHITRNIVDALKVFFEHALGTLLLYRQERPLYEMEVEAKKLNPLKVYGAQHLLRLFGMPMCGAILNYKLPRFLSEDACVGGEHWLERGTAHGHWKRD